MLLSKQAPVLFLSLRARPRVARQGGTRGCLDRSFRLRFRLTTFRRAAHPFWFFGLPQGE